MTDNDKQLYQEALNHAIRMVVAHISIIAYYGIEEYISTYLRNTEEERFQMFPNEYIRRQKADLIAQVLREAVHKIFSYLETVN